MNNSTLKWKMSVFHAFGLLFCLVGVLSAQSFPVEKIAVGKFWNTCYVIIYCLLFFIYLFIFINLYYFIMVAVNYCCSLYIFLVFLRVFPFYCSQCFVSFLLAPNVFAVGQRYRFSLSFSLYPFHSTSSEMALSARFKIFAISLFYYVPFYIHKFIFGSFINKLISLTKYSFLFSVLSV